MSNFRLRTFSMFTLFFRRLAMLESHRDQVFAACRVALACVVGLQLDWHHVGLEELLAGVRSQL